jgi:hypothetical protein
MAMSMLEKHLKELSQLVKAEPKTVLGVREVIDILLDIKTDDESKSVIIDGDEMAKYFGGKRKTPVSESRFGINEGLA